MPPPIVHGRSPAPHVACPKCFQESGVEREGDRWFCSVCSHDWSDAASHAAPSRETGMPADAPRTVGIMQIHPRILP